MQKNINSIVGIFPDYEERIEYLFLSDGNFRDLCKDYILCASKVLDMKKELNKYNAQIEEYEVLQRQLEDELLKIIIEKRNKSLPPHFNGLN